MMTDIVSQEKRSQMMKGIRSRNTKPEIIVRSWLHKNGYRFRLHRKDLPGRPDLVLPKWETVILINGCFFHHHEGCRLAYIPKTRTEWWMEKFKVNAERDERNIRQLESLGWQVLVIWECQVRDGSYKSTILEHLLKISSKGRARQ